MLLPPHSPAETPHPQCQKPTSNKPNSPPATARVTPAGDPRAAARLRWPDGCVYEGQWRNGRPCGKGRFTWPSGATYAGDFLSGRVHGVGTFLGTDGDAYTGAWVSDRKHGLGQKRYANGDVYEGSWRANLQDGHGRYLWSNGNEYVGAWSSGQISGRGIMIWANGNRFEGFWENGVLKGVKDDRDHGKDRNFTRKRLLVDDGSPRICIWESDKEEGDITCDIVDGARIGVMNNVGADLERSPCLKKPGRAVSKGHKNYDLILNVQLGIRYSVGKHASILREFGVADFDPKEKFSTRFPSEGSKFTPPHQSVDFRWKDYCPIVFRHLRELFGIDPADYMLAICGNDTLRELPSPGKSGSLFYLTQDDRFMIKTVKKSEVKVLIRMLSSYHQHVSKHKNSLITKFLGVHCVKPVGGLKTRFVVMGNLFCSEHRIHRRFDLKGSSYGRTTDKPEGGIDETTTLKDLDLNFVFHLEPSWFQELMWQIDRDCEFLEAERIMDYSLLIGMHFLDDLGGEMQMSPSDTNAGKRMHNDETLVRGYRLIKGQQNLDRILEDRGALIRLGSNVPARAERRVQRRMQPDQSAGSGSGDSTPSQNGGEMFGVVLHFGIIDILQDYDITKKIEHAYKSLQVDSASISAVGPKLYSRRFRDFIKRVFVEERRAEPD